MSEATLPREDAAPVRPHHYQILCGTALGALFLIQLQQGLFLLAALGMLIGAAAILLRVRISPILVLIPLILGQIWLVYPVPGLRAQTALQVEDVVLCAAALGYVAGHYRLLSLWRNILPTDPRQRYHKRAAAIVPLNRLGRVAVQHRPASLLSRTEIAWLVLELPVFALLAQGAWIVLGIQRDVFGLPARWVQLGQIIWGLTFGVLIAGQIIRSIRLLRMDRLTARMLLQDALWHETRREQRRIGRWLAWGWLRRMRKQSPQSM